MTPLDELLAHVEVTRRSGPDVPIASIEYDSRRVLPGSLFVAMKGGAADGNRFIEKATQSGAVAIATDTSTSFESCRRSHPDMALIQVAHGRRALAELCRTFYHYPDEHLGLTGVTGTNGKTTTAFLLEQLLRHHQRKTVLVGTIEYRVAERVMPAPHTTPESRDLLAIFADGVAEGVTEAVMEVSSHALDQGRVWQLAFDVAIFTNLTRDHLDYHGTMDDYMRAKQRLFDGSCSQTPKFAVLNADDPASETLASAAARAGAAVTTYGIEKGDIQASDIHLEASGTIFQMHTPSGIFAIESRLVGRINVYNLLAAAVAAKARGMDYTAIREAAKFLAPPPGRFETVEAGQPFTVIVDYAHTDDALKNVTRLARELTITDESRIITVFGCGGDRDMTKRPLMGKAAGQGSDTVIVTSDNPRSEDPMAIIEQILPGLQSTPAKTIVEPDREHAIRLALEEARPGDLVLIAGKGHEKTQTIGARVLPFDDAAIARRILSAFASHMKGNP